MDFVCDERRSDSPFIERVWYSHSGENGGSFTSMAETHWSMVVTKIQGQATFTVRGPETRASAADCPPDAEFFGIMFKAGTLMPTLPAKMLMDRCDVNLPDAGREKFWLNGATWQLPNFENADTFVNRLVRDGLVIHDPVVAAVLQGEPLEMSLRTMQRQFLQATGLTYGTMSQINRARHATTLLKQGVSILDTVELAGYSDQPHLTRSLKHFTGQTPAQLAYAGRVERLSFLFKTLPF